MTVWPQNSYPRWTSLPRRRKCDGGQDNMLQNGSCQLLFSIRMRHSQGEVTQIYREDMKLKDYYNIIKK